jgi:hypothetical protein
MEGDMEVITGLRCLACLLLLCCGRFCLAQEITVRVISAANGRPVPKQRVSVTLSNNAVLNLETDADGEAHFKLPEPSPVRFVAQARLDWSHWSCGCVVEGSTNDLVQKGILGSPFATVRKKYTAILKPAPREILFVAKPLSFLERLLYPLAKE